MGDKQKRDADLQEQVSDYRRWLSDRIDAITEKVLAAEKKKITLILELRERNTLRAVREELDRRFGCRD